MFVREICNEEFRGNFAKIEKKKNILTNRGRKRSALMIVYIK